MPKSNFDISLNTYLPYLLLGLKKDGVDIYRFLKHRHLRDLNLFDSDKYIPIIYAYEDRITVKILNF